MKQEIKQTVENLSSRKLWMIVDKREQSVSSAMMNAAYKELTRRRHTGMDNRFHLPR